MTILEKFFSHYYEWKHKIGYHIGKFFYDVSEWFDSGNGFYCKQCNSCGINGCCDYKCKHIKSELYELNYDLKYIKTQLLAKNLEAALNSLDELIEHSEKK